MKLSQAFQTLYQPRQLRSASPATLRLWKIALRHFDRFLRRPATTSDLNDNTVSRFVTWRLQDVSAATANKDLASILALWRFLHRHRKVKQYPSVQLEREPKRIPTAWTREEFDKLFAAACRCPGMIDHVPARIWWPTLLLVLLDSAERISAVLSLRWDDVDLSSRWIVFPAETRKARDADSAVAIADDTLGRLHELRKFGSRPKVFPWPYHRTYLWHKYGILLESAGLPNDRKRKFHAIRRTVASHVEAAGGNATEILRHASRTNTLAYLDPRIVTPQQAKDLMWRPRTTAAPNDDGE